MQYVNSKFTLPVNTSKMTDLEYEIKVGKRCDQCKELIEQCKCKKLVGL